MVSKQICGVIVTTNCKYCLITTTTSNSIDSVRVFCLTEDSLFTRAAKDKSFIEVDLRNGRAFC